MDIKIKIPDSEQACCKLCNKQCANKMGLPAHIANAHKLEFSQYLVDQYLSGARPKCPICNENTRYNRGKYSFKKYCVNHVKEAQKEWSRQNGFGAKVEAGWKLGLTKETNISIAKQAEKVSGQNNPFYGKQHTEEIMSKLSASRKKTSRISEAEFEERKNGNHTVCLTPYTDYITLSAKNLQYECTSCNRNFTASLLHNDCNICTRKEIANNPDIMKKIADSLKYSESEFLERILSRSEDFEVITPYSEYKNHDIDKLSVKCKNCANIMERTLFALTSGTLCRICSPFSKEEKEINSFLEEHNIKSVRNSRNLIKPKELDFIIEEKKIALEYNGLFWHMENNKDKNYHNNKTIACAEKGYQLFHIFSDEWQTKKDIVKSMIMNRLKISKTKIHARDCEVYSTDKQEDIKNFTDNTHISGHTQFTKAFYLKYNDEIICALTLRKPFHKKYKDTVEIARFSSSLNCNIVGGFSKLFKYVKEWAISAGYKNILSYADLRFGTGNVYSLSGFKLIGKTAIDYWYTDGKVRYNRFKYRAQPNKTEKEVAKEEGVQRIYGCGSNIYEYSLA
jgi:very-short-patch-repair endonuclease